MRHFDSCSRSNLRVRFKAWFHWTSSHIALHIQTPDVRITKLSAKSVTTPSVQTSLRVSDCPRYDSQQLGSRSSFVTWKLSQSMGHGDGECGLLLQARVHSYSFAILSLLLFLSSLPIPLLSSFSPYPPLGQWVFCRTLYTSIRKKNDSLVKRNTHSYHCMIFFF